MISVVIANNATHRGATPSMAIISSLDGMATASNFSMYANTATIISSSVRTIESSSLCEHACTIPAADERDTTSACLAPTVEIEVEVVELRRGVGRGLAQDQRIALSQHAEQAAHVSKVWTARDTVPRHSHCACEAGEWKEEPLHTCLVVSIFGAKMDRAQCDRLHAALLSDPCTPIPPKHGWASRDSAGRTLAMVAASAGLARVFKQHTSSSSPRLQTRSADYDADSESKWTSLHRAVYYGHLDIAAGLLSPFPRSLPLPCDSEGFSPLDLVTLGINGLLDSVKLPRVHTVKPLPVAQKRVLTMSDAWSALLSHNHDDDDVDDNDADKRISANQSRIASSVYGFGSNSSYTLGIADPEHKDSAVRVAGFLGADGEPCSPSIVEVGLLLSTIHPKRQLISIFIHLQVSTAKYHTLFLSDDGRVYACGHALDGKLGLPESGTCMVPRLLPFFLSIQCAAVAVGR